MRVIFTGFTTKLRRTSSVFLLLRRVRSKTHLSCVSAPWFAWWQGAPGGQHIRWKKKKKNLFFKLPLFLLTAEAKKKRERGKKQCLLVAKQLGGEVRACSLLLPLEWTCFSSSVLSLIFPFFFKVSIVSPRPCPLFSLCSARERGCIRTGICCQAAAKTRTALSDRSSKPSFCRSEAEKGTTCWASVRP